MKAFRFKPPTGQVQDIWKVLVPLFGVKVVVPVHVISGGDALVTITFSKEHATGARVWSLPDVAPASNC